MDLIQQSSAVARTKKYFMVAWKIRLPVSSVDSGDKKFENLLTFE